jgi:ribose-phosphate pyrophosphokinase
MKMSYAYAKALGANFAIVAKHRRSATEVDALDVIGEVEGKKTLLVDDMTETAGTLTAAAKLLKARGAQRIIAGVTHAVLNEKAHQRISDSVIEELICTDSVPMASGPKVTTLSIAEMLGEAIRRIHQGESVTSLFDIGR